MKKITKRLVGIALTAGLALTVGVGVSNVYDSYQDTTITASAEATKIDLTSSIKILAYGTTGDYSDSPLYRIALTENDSKAYDFGYFCANEYGGEMLKWIKINGKSIYDHRAEYQAAVKAGERAPVTSKQPNIEANQTADNIYAPIFVNLTYHPGIPAKCIDIYMPNDYMTKDQVKSIEITADFTTSYASEKRGTTPTETCYLSKSVIFKDVNNQRMGKWVEGAMEKREVTIKAPFTKIDEATNFFGTQLIDSDYAGSGSNNTAPGFKKELLDSLNFWDYVEFDGVKLSTMITDPNIPGEVGLNVWGAESALCFRFPSFTADYMNGLTEIKYLAGCQFPSFTNPTGAYFELAEDVTFIKYNGAWVNKAALKTSEDVTFGGGYVSGDANELVKFEFTIKDFALTEDDRDGYDWNYGGAQGLQAREHIFINDKSLYEIAKTVDDSGYTYSSNPMNKLTEQNDDGVDRFSNPAILFGNIKDTNNVMQILVHKDYLATLGDEVTITIAQGFQNWAKDTTVTEDVSQTYYRYADGSYGMVKPEVVETEVSEISTTVHSHNFITFTLGDLDVPAEVTDLQIIGIDNAAKYSKTNFMNYIYINGKPMSEMVPGEVIYNLGGSKTISVRVKAFGQEGDEGFDKNVFTAAIKTIEIKAGCQFPAYSYAYEGGEVKAYTVAEDMLWVNDGATWNSECNVVITDEAGETISSQVVAPLTVLSEPEQPTKEVEEGYTVTFLGWYNGEEKWDFSTPVKGDVTLTPKFEVKKETSEPEYVEVTLNEGENTITMAAGQYATSYVNAMGDYTFSWTGEATVTVGDAPVENGSVVTLMNPMFGRNNVVITPANAEAECTVVLTVAAYVAPAVEMVLGANAIEVTDSWKGTNVTFTAEEAGEYVLKAAEGEENAVVFMETESVSEMLELPYTFTLEAGESVAWLVLTGNYEVDTIDLVLEKVEEEPIDPPTSSDEPTTSEPADSSDEPTTSEPADSSDEPTTSEPADSSDEPTTSEPTTSEPTASSSEEEKKSGGCGSVIGGVSAALTLVAAAAVVMKKKED